MGIFRRMFKITALDEKGKAKEIELTDDDDELFDGSDGIEFPFSVDNVEPVPKPAKREPQRGSAGYVISRAKAIDNRVAARQIDELIGICRGVLIDGAVTDSEAQYLVDWMETHVECSDQWPYNVLYKRISEAILDGKITEAEERDLLILLHQVAGARPSITSQGHIQEADTEGLPYDDPPPVISFEGCKFCVTGDFAYGPRNAVIEAIETRGGRVTGSVSGKTSYLVVGLTASTAWKHSTHGTKIIKALELRQAGKSVAIVSEKHWTEFLA